MDAQLKRAVLLGMLAALPALSALAQPGIQARVGPSVEQEFYRLISERKSQVENDNVDLLLGLIGDAEPGSEAARKLIYRLAAVYYRQLRSADAQALTASLDAGQPNAKLGPRMTAAGAMIPLVQKNDLLSALAVGEAAMPRYQEELSTAATADEILGSALASSEPGSAAHESISGRRVATMARLASATFDLARLHSAIAEVYHARKQLPKAEQHYRAALALFEKQQGSDPAPYIYTRTGLAALLRARGDAGGALPLQEAALDAMKKSYARTDPDRLEGERELAQLKAALGLRPDPVEAVGKTKGARRPARR